MRYLRLLRTITLVFYLYSTLIACNVQKKRYSHGFYFGNQKSVTTKSINQELQIDSLSSLPYLLSKNLIEPPSEKANLKPEVSPTSPPQLSISTEIKKLNQIVLFDTIPKSKKLISSKQVNVPKKRMEIFTLLSLCIYFLTIATIYLVIISIYFFSVTEIIILLSSISLIYPLAQFLLAFVGSIIVKKHPNKYKDDKLAEFLMVYSLFCFLLSFIWLYLAHANFGD